MDLPPRPAQCDQTRRINHLCSLFRRECPSAPMLISSRPCESDRIDERYPRVASIGAPTTALTVLSITLSDSDLATKPIGYKLMPNVSQATSHRFSLRRSHSARLRVIGARRATCRFSVTSGCARPDVLGGDEQTVDVYPACGEKFTHDDGRARVSQSTLDSHRASRHAFVSSRPGAYADAVRRCAGASVPVRCEGGGW